MPSGVVVSTTGVSASAPATRRLAAPPPSYTRKIGSRSSPTAPINASLSAAAPHQREPVRDRPSHGVLVREHDAVLGRAQPQRTDQPALDVTVCLFLVD